jgi:hypothetical protein
MKNTSTRGRIGVLAALVAIVAFVVVTGSSASGAPQEEHADHWGIITRNTIGSPVAALRKGPYGSIGVTGPSSRPPYGIGSLGIETANNSTTLAPPAEKVDFGNEVDFYGDQVLALTKVGFHVFQTNENASPLAGQGGSPRNMPNIRFEIDPNGAVNPSNYTTMVWDPPAAPVVNRWSGYIDATTTGDWYFTGSTGTTTGCNMVTTCTFAQAKNSLNDGSPTPTFYSVAVGKGRDSLWVGAVDGLRMNNTVYDFEPLGVVEHHGCGGGGEHHNC